MVLLSLRLITVKDWMGGWVVQQLLFSLYILTMDILTYLINLAVNVNEM
jgi:hypothetical protein